MDPNAAIDGINEGIRDGDYQHVADCAEGLLGWLGRGGFPPSNHSRPVEFARDALRWAAQHGAEVSTHTEGGAQ